MSPQAGYLLVNEVRPRLISAIPYAVQYIAPEDAHELVQDGTAMAARMMHNAEHSGKKVLKSASNGKNTITAGNVTYYTIEKLRSGRRSTGSSISDVYGSGTQITGRTRLTSLNEVVASDEESGGEIYELGDVLADGHEDPSARAARSMDWQTFMAALDERELAIINSVVEGRTFREAARASRCSDTAIRESRKRLVTKVLDFMGLDILVTIQNRPQWKSNLDATRERLACREERRRL